MGQPVEDGMIHFTPKAGNDAPATGGQIVKGQYRIDLRGGVQVGEYHVSIESFSTDRARLNSDTPSRKQLLPNKYNRQSKLEFSAPAGSGPITHDFNLQK